MSRFETDDEQVAALKNWWDKNGTQLLTGVLIVVLAWSGWTYYQKNQIAKASHASTTFEVLQSKMQQGAFGDVAREGLKLMEEQPDSPYSTATALMLAKYELNKGEVDEALKHLNWVVKQHLDDAMVLIAQLRIANIYIDQKQYEQAKTLLASIQADKLVDAEKANYDYVSAQLALKQSRFDDARKALQNVVDNAKAPTNLQNIARLQLDDLTQ
ncbi:MAG: tetratricopeptide repeat protein [Hydrogenovibrio sp.]|nr:tetratricopeptide repeat protein [Hydrogenovibrio sp.]